MACVATAVLGNLLSLKEKCFVSTASQLQEVPSEAGRSESP